MKLSEISVEPLTQKEVVNGNVLHVMKSIDRGFIGFGEAYFSWIKGDAIKAWKRHKSMTMNLVVPFGGVKFVFCDIDHNKSLKEYRVEIIGSSQYSRITVPPGVWFGFQGLAYPSSLVLNISDILHDSTEAERLDLSDIPFDWDN